MRTITLLTAIMLASCCDRVRKECAGRRRHFPAELRLDRLDRRPSATRWGNSRSVSNKPKGDATTGQNPTVHDEFEVKDQPEVGTGEDLKVRRGSFRRAKRRNS